MISSLTFFKYTSWDTQNVKMFIFFELYSIIDNLWRAKLSMTLTIYIWIWLVCLGVCFFLYPINVKTAEPIGPKFFVGHHVTTGKVYEWSKFQIFVSINIRSSLNFWKLWKSTKFFVKIRELFLSCFTMSTKRTCSQLT